MDMTSKAFGRPRTYPLADLAVGGKTTMPAPTPADVKRIARNVSQYGMRHNRRYMCRTDRQTGVMTITRLF